MLTHSSLKSLALPLLLAGACWPLGADLLGDAGVTEGLCPAFIRTDAGRMLKLENAPADLTATAVEKVSEIARAAEVEPHSFYTAP